MSTPESMPSVQTRRARIVDSILYAFALATTILVSSFVARNSDVWQHLSLGRLIANGAYDFKTDPLSYASEGVRWVNHFWLTDWIWYQIFQRLGGAGLVALKSITLLLCFCTVTWRRHRSDSYWSIALVILTAAVILSPRAVLHPMIASCFFLAITLRALQAGGRALVVIPLITIVWANMDEWFVLAPILSIAHWISSRPRGETTVPVWNPLLTCAACLATPFHIHGLTLPSELSLSLWQSDLMKDPRVANQFASYFNGNPLTSEHSDSLAFWLFVMTGLFGSITLIVNHRKVPFWTHVIWGSSLFLAVWQSRLTPFFAVVTAAIFADHVRNLISEKRFRRIGRGATLIAILCVWFVCWGGWLQGSRGRDRIMGWNVHADPTLVQAAETLQQWRKNRVLEPNSRVLCVTPDASNTLAWFANGEKGFLDTRWDFHARTFKTTLNGLPLELGLAGTMVANLSEIDAKSLGISVVLLSDPTSQALEAVTAQVSPWRIVQVDGRSIWLVAPDIFVNSPIVEQATVSNNWNPQREAFGESANEVRFAARFTKFNEWWQPVSSQRLNTTAHAGTASSYSNLFLASKSDAPELPMLAIRESRQAISKNPDDSQAWLELAKAYSLLGAKVENRLANQCGLLRELRRVQRVTALSNAVMANPESEASRDALAGTLADVGYLDRALMHRKAQRTLIARRGDRERLEAVDNVIQKLEDDLFDRECLYQVQTPKMSGDPLGRARIAISLGLANLALDTLLKSSPDLYGADGLRLLAGLLLGTGQTSEVKTLLDREELRQFSGRLGVHEIASLTLDGNRIVYRVPAYDWYQFLLAASSGISDPKIPLASLEKYLISEVVNARGTSAKIAAPVSATIAIEIGLGSTGMFIPQFINTLRREEILGPITQSRLLIAEHADLAFLEGCTALEFGQWAHALKCFETARADYARVADLKVAPAKELVELYRSKLSEFHGKR